MNNFTFSDVKKILKCPFFLELVETGHLKIYTPKHYVGYIRARVKQCFPMVFFTEIIRDDRTQGKHYAYFS